MELRYMLLNHMGRSELLRKPNNGLDLAKI
jgi:hypothetical protein